MKKFILSILFLSVLINTYTQQTKSLTQAEKDAIIYIREEEKLARDVYNKMFEKWSGNPFENIRRSEQMHMDRVQNLIQNYNLEDPVVKNNDKQGKFTNEVLQKYYNELIVAGEASLVEGLKAGAKIEEIDITDLVKRTALTTKDDIITNFNYLKMASENHLRAFVKRLKMNGINYEPVILSKEDFEKIIKDDNNRVGWRGGM